MTATDADGTTETIGVVLGQVGTPQSPDRREVRRYLREFLSDDRIIDLPRWQWKPILHGFVLPFRPWTISRYFAEIWTDDGSPLEHISRRQRAGVQDRLGPDYRVELAMAYSQPSMAQAMDALHQAGIRKVLVLPMFPQFSTSTTASIYDEAVFHALGRPARRGLPRKSYSPTLRFVHPYYDDPEYIDVLARNIASQLDGADQPDRIVISFHGMPRRYIDQGDPYQDHVEHTVDLLAARMGWSPDDYELAFQSRFGKTEWIKPYLQPRLEELHGDGIGRPAIVSPGFTSDCLETLHELGIQGRELYADGGGDPDHYRTLACLNDDPHWLDYLAALISRNTDGW